MHPPPIAASIAETSGATPVVRLSRAVPSGRVLAKLEALNPTGSAADRIARCLLERAEREGRLNPGATIIEATLGNTGIALAPLCASRGYRLIVCMPESMSLERRATLRTWGVQLELTPADAHIEGAKARAKELSASIPGAWVMPQWEPGATAALHEEGLGAELVEQAMADGGRIDAFVAGIGTGGTLEGVARALRARFPNVRIVAAVPGREGPHRIQGLVAREAAFEVARAIGAEIVDVDDRDAWTMKERIGRAEGFLVGVSSGAAVWGAARVADGLGADARVYTVCWDTGERYFSLEERFR